MSKSFGRGLHTAPGRAVNLSAYESYLGRWSRLFAPSVLAAAEIVPGCRVLDVATGTGEAARMAISIVGDTGFVVGADISLEMVQSARVRLDEPLYLPLNADGQALPFNDATFDAIVCQLGLQFFPSPAAGLTSFGASSEWAGWRRFASLQRQIGHPCGAISPMHCVNFFHSSATSSRCHGRLPIRRCWKGCSAMLGSRTFMSNGSGARTPSTASMTTGHRSKTELGHFHWHIAR